MRLNVAQKLAVCVKQLGGTVLEEMPYRTNQESNQADQANETSPEYS
jgi:hypothetical protein